MIVYNTLTRKKEEFVPIKKGEVSLYSCGPTVYNYAHIGNLRTYLFMDLLRRTLRQNGFTLRHVMNITDVGHLVSDGDEGEDKMLKGAREQQKTPWEIAEFYTQAFFNDLQLLHIEKPECICKVTDHIPDMIDFVRVLQEKGYGYETSDGIYFDIAKFPDYGKLSRADLEEQLAGARVDVNDEKRHPADFALWKKAPKEHIMQWESPWGMGYPGWHIECSALARKYLGDTFDMHTGGVDHIPIHHENEIAQTEALTGKKAVNVWMHGEFMMVEGGKMSKSLRNVYTLDDLYKKGFLPLSFRYFCLNAHYRNKLNFTFEALTGAQTAFLRMIDLVLLHQNGQDSVEAQLLAQWQADFDEAVTDDLNIPKALGVVWNALRHAEKSKDIYDFVLKADTILGLGLSEAQKLKDSSAALLQADIPPAVMDLVNRRAQARKDKNWPLSDALRNEIKTMGYVVEDTKEGQKVSGDSRT